MDFHTGRDEPPTSPLRPIIPDNACTLRITAAAGTELAGAYSTGKLTHACSPIKEVYNPKASIPHAASLHQACAHCAIFPTAASRRSLGRISVPMWPVALSGRLPVEATVGRYPAVKLIGRDPIPYRESFPRRPCDQLEHPALPPVSRSYSGVWGRSVTHYSPVRHSHHQAKPDGSRSTCMC